MVRNPGSLTQNLKVPADSIEFTSPVRGEVVHTFGEQIIVPDTGRVYANQGIDVKTGEDAPVFASADGVVAAVEEHEATDLPSGWITAAGYLPLRGMRQD